MARGVFADRLDLATRFAGLLADDGVIRGLIGPREAPRLWERHLINCALLADALPPASDVCDLGSGAGLPGLVLAIRRPDLRVTLVEPLLRRTTFLTEVVERLDLEQVEVVRARAEDLHGTREFSVVTSRAVAPLGRLLDWSMPLVRQHGHLVAMKGSSAQDEIGASARELRRHGAGTVEVLTYGDGEIDPPTTVIRVEATRPSGLGWDAADQHRRDTRSPGRSRARKGRRS
ncbi:16S rRNA (guanine(527)-N(7))-methyltransferase RsmG [soil metagenome]